MNYENELYDKTNYLFSRNFLAELDGTNDISEEEEQEYSDTVEKLYNNYDWNNIFSCWNNYLLKYCKTERDIINFANLFWTYGGYKNYIPEPYKFLSYFYYKVDVNKHWDIMRDLIDGMTIEILHRAGVTGVTNSENPYYNPQEDPKMIAEIKKWKEQEKNKTV